ncbi:hypothetical protein PVT67_16175 [Gallaecimonas kandeliae]|uniref:hypothetical protein n=1 Tax=Gallaecimonas kandeliae TaxID=3029055 RepID=UPI0026478CE0|nr:hypothetical protein [Gallaecimonas kandeliae]WKE65180.1 hypothetical protein PVT67_16175 [Gallaecimonas kandeliae]
MNKTLAIALLSLLLAACAGTPKRPLGASDYDHDLKAPQSTEDFVLTEKKVFDQPELGVMLRYANKDFPEDNISLYVYPINRISWANSSEALEGEMDNAVKDIDGAVSYGLYQSRTPEKRSDFKVGALLGRKAALTLTSKKGVLYYSDIYLFMAKDKFIKFRTSYDSRTTNPWSGSGDQVVQELLPGIQVPPESAYMKAQREQRKQKLLELFRQIIKQAEQQGKTQH